jgi:hypothetical protein
MTQPMVRSGRYEAQLTPSQAGALGDALLSGNCRIADIRKTAPPWRTGSWAGQLPSVSTLSELRERLQLRQTAANNETTARILGGVLSDTLPDITQEQLDSLGYRTFTTHALRRQDSQAFLRLSTARNQLELERQRLAQRDVALDLARQKLRRDTCERFLEWYEDQRAQEIADSNGSNADKIEALGRIMFGENWREPASKVPEAAESGPANERETTDS